GKARGDDGRGPDEGCAGQARIARLTSKSCQPAAAAWRDGRARRLRAGPFTRRPMARLVYARPAPPAPGAAPRSLPCPVTRERLSMNAVPPSSAAAAPQSGAGTARIIDGAALSQRIRGEVAERAAALASRGVKPGLAVILVGDDPASQVYVRNKVAACEKAGLHSVLERYPATLSEDELLARVRALNADPSIHGILVQLPLPAHMNAHKVIETIAPEKDVDGFHVSSAGLLMTGKPLFRPCTPYGVMKMLEAEGVPLRGAEAVIVGASNIVGKPMAM